MKKILILLLVAGLMILGMVAAAYAIDAPHNDTNQIVCADCHLQGTGAIPTDADCLSCHNTASPGPYSKLSAPLVETHSSANTSSHYGTWTQACVDCHYPHFQEMPALFGSQSYLATGTITAVTTSGSNTVYTYSNLSVNANYPEWNTLSTWGAKTSAGRGLIIFPNLANTNFSHEIISANSSTITVQGIESGETAPSNFAVIYGQVPQNDVNTPFGSVTALFFNHQGPNSFAYDESGTGTDPTPNGMCQVCHSQTLHWRYDGTLANHNNGANCTECHPHAQGFAATGCTGCHGDPPPAVVSIPSATGSPGAGAHTYHVNLSMTCSACHTGDTDMIPSINPDNKIRMGFVINSTNFTGFNGTSTTGTYSPFSPITAPYTFISSNPGTVIGTGTANTCTNLYCHSNVQAAGGTGSPTQYDTPLWTAATVACDSCHGTLAQGTGAPNSGSHLTHLNNGPYNYSCNECHNGAGNGTPQHVDYTIEMANLADPFGTTGSYSRGNHSPGIGSYGTCSNVYCHSSVQGNSGTGPGLYNTPSWGGVVVCGGCHGNPPTTNGAHLRHSGGDSNNYAFNCSVCHSSAGSPGSGTYGSAQHADKIIQMAFNPTYGPSASYQLGANVTPGSGYGNCSNTYCHSDGTSVSTGTNPPANTSPSWADATTCGSCHGGGDATGQPAYANGSPKANSHLQHSADCSRCHYGTTTTGISITNYTNHVNKAYDVQPAPGVTFTYTYAPFNGNASAPTGGSCSNISCHSNSSATWGTIVACGGCHPVPPTTYAHATHTSALSSATALYGDAGNLSNTTAYGFNCGNCHPLDQSKHGDGIVEVELYNVNASTGTLKAMNQSTASYSVTPGTTFNGTCVGVYCHSNGTVNPTYVTSTFPQWNQTYAGIGGDHCAQCHGNSPTGTPAHASHVVGIHYDTLYTGSSGLMTAGTGGTNSHGSEVYSTTINCNICHNKTVTVGYNDQNTVCGGCHNGSTAPLHGNAAIANKAYHVNGTVDVTFINVATNPLLSKAQIRNDITTVAELNANWARQNGYKQNGSFDQGKNAPPPLPSYNPATWSCSSVVCHNGYQVNWNVQNIGCISCHTAVTN